MGTVFPVNGIAAAISKHSSGSKELGTAQPRLQPVMGY